MARAMYTALLLSVVPQFAQAADTREAAAVDPSLPIRHSKGFVPDPARFNKVEPVQRYRDYLPAKYDLAADLPPPGNQGDQSSCVAWAVGYAARTFYLKHYYSMDVTKNENQISPAYIYNTLRQSHDACDSGTSPIDALELLKASGGVPLSVLPYNPRNCVMLPSREELSNYSNRFKIRGYRRIEAIEAERGKLENDVKGELYKGNPVIFGIEPGPAFDRYRGGVIDSTVKGDGGHAMVIVGYDDEQQAFHFVNSWGTLWGEKGFGWLSYKATNALWLEGYVMSVDVPPRPPEPPPAPAPPSPAIVDVPQLDPTAPCSRVTSNAVRTGSGFVVKLTGFVGKPEDLQNILDVARRQAGVTGVDSSDVSLRPWPQCEALLTLNPALGNSLGLSVSKSPDKAEFVRGENFSFTVHSPNYASYLYVAYLQADGSAKFLFRPAGLGMTPPNTIVRLGEGPKVVHYRVGPPYGNEMVVALASDTPLLGDDAPVDDRELLTDYRRAMLHAQLASAAIVTLETAEQ